MVGYFNARDEMWCRDHNRAGRLLNEQLQNLVNFCLMNHPQFWTTMNKTEIDVSLLPVDIVPLTNGSIHPGLVSDHFAVQLEIQHQHNTEMDPTTHRLVTLPKTHNDSYNKHRGDIHFFNGRICFIKENSLKKDI